METHGVTHGICWRKDVVNQCLEFGTIEVFRGSGRGLQSVGLCHRTEPKPWNEKRQQQQQHTHTHTRARTHARTHAHTHTHTHTETNKTKTTTPQPYSGTALRPCCRRAWENILPLLRMASRQARRTDQSFL